MRIENRNECQQQMTYTPALGNLNGRGVVHVNQEYLSEMKAGGVDHHIFDYLANYFWAAMFAFATIAASIAVTLTSSLQMGLVTLAVGAVPTVAAIVMPFH